MLSLLLPILKRPFVLDRALLNPDKDGTYLFIYMFRQLFRHKLPLQINSGDCK